MSAPDSYTSLLIHSNTTNGDGVFIDEIGHTITNYGTPTHTTDEAKFGTTSIDLSDNVGQGTSGPDAMYGPNSTDFEFGNGDFTVDLWAYPLETVYAGLIAYNNRDGGVGAYGYYLMYGNEADKFGGVFVDSTITNHIVDGNTDTTYINKWNHVALVRAGSTLYLFVNGISQSTANVGTLTQYLNPVQKLNIGCFYTNPVVDVSYSFHGYLDEVRVSKGIARWTENFTPPPYPYNSSAYVVQGTLNDSAEVMVINEDNWAMGNHGSKSTGTYEVVTTSGSKLVVARRTTDGEVISYGSVDSKYIETGS